MSDRNSIDETGISPIKELDIRAKRILCKKLAGVISDDDFIEEFEKVRMDLIKLTSDENGNYVQVEDEPNWIAYFYTPHYRFWKHYYLEVKRAKKTNKHFTEEDWNKIDDVVNTLREQTMRDIDECLMGFVRQRQEDWIVKPQPPQENYETEDYDTNIL